MKWILVFGMVAAVVITRAAGEMELSEITLRVNGVERNYTGTVYQAENTELNWLVNGTRVISIFIETDEGSPNLTSKDNLFFNANESIYGFSHEVSGMNVTSTLTIKTEEGYGDVMLKIINTNKTYAMTSGVGAESTAAEAVPTTTVATSVMPETMSLSDITFTETGAERNYTGTVHHAVRTELKWNVNGTNVVSAYIEVNEDGSLNLTDPDNPTNITDEALYGFSFDISGSNVTTTLTIKSVEGYGDVMLAISTMNSSLPMSSVSSTAEGTVNPMTSTDEMSESTTSEATAIPVTSTDGMPVSTTSQSMGLPNCDVANRSCYESVVFNCSREVTMESCTVSYQCKNETYTEPNITCEGKRVCISPGVWGANCDKSCGQGCPTLNNYTAIHICDVTTGRCLNNETNAALEAGNCVVGWKGDRCETPKCDQSCNGGECLAPNFCGNCPRHYESGVTCRNVSLDGFSKGSLPTLAILGAVVIILKIASDFYERTKKKSD